VGNANARRLVILQYSAASLTALKSLVAQPGKRPHSEIIWMKWPPVKFLIKPTENANFRGAERLQPTVHKKVYSRGCGRDLFRFRDHRAFGADDQGIGLDDILSRFRGGFESV